MDRRTRMVLGKRGRRVMDPPSSPTNFTTAPKRSRARRHERVEVAEVEVEDEASKPQTRSRSGLLTPEPSVLTKSQICDSLNASPPLPPRDIFPFMSLPAELRLHIYFMALVRATPLYLHAARPAQPDEQDSPTSPNSRPDAIPAAHNPLQSLPTPPRRPSRAATASPDLPPYQPDPIVPAILRLNKQIHREARQLLYAENTFTLSLASGIHTLSTLHQRSRSLIKHVMLTIPSHHDILDGFADLVRLGLRYCWRLKSFKIVLQASLPDDGRVSGATSVYANAFHILRWLPRGCSVVLEGCVSETVRRVVVEEGRLMNVLDETSYLKRQHQMPERH
ncbi:hypothetical protein EK21DRAFT_103651 [Setomelanomma holmii]|uniref:Uncharacterized protein n=1 Tax=Setomelanomma holmii TaxID=210430 RepID=A0A9P4H1I1_9PLEO|nr:hypothetical protein EK21DRAFT_103651 [Setomelanomma holmii]